jgi:hypothetical protein
VLDFMNPQRAGRWQLRLLDFRLPQRRHAPSSNLLAGGRRYVVLHEVR